MKIFSSSDGQKKRTFRKPNVLKELKINVQKYPLFQHDKSVHKHKVRKEGNFLKLA